MRPRRWLAAAVVAMALNAGAAQRAMGEPVDAATPPDIGATLPSTPAGKQLEWYIDALNGRVELGDPAERFTPEFLKAVPAERVKQLVQQLRSSAFKSGATVESVRPGGGEGELVATVRGAAVLEISIAVNADGKINGLLIRPPAPPRSPFAAWPDLDARLKGMPGSVSFAAARVTINAAGEPTLHEVHAFNADRCQAIGSTFKLWVLGALAEKVLAKQASWDEKLAIQSELKSLPNGEMQNLAPGSEFPLSEYAAKMISISDNTATDHLLAFVGRDTVEAYQAARNSCAEKTSPFLSTMEMFRIKLASDTSLVTRYAEADAAGRRALISGKESEVAKTVPNLAIAAAWKNPIAIDRVEWFASARDCCKAIAWLHAIEKREGMSELSRVMRINPGMSVDKKVWKSVAFKGGSEPGVLNLTWLLERDDGAFFAVSIGWNDTERPVDLNALLATAGGIVDLLAKSER